LTVNAPEQYAGLFGLGRTVQFVVPAYPDTFSARITAVGAGLDPETRTLGVRASLDSRGNRLKPGMLATAIVAGGSSGTAVMVPEGAVQTMDGKPTVFVVHPDGKGGARLERRDVEIGGRANGRVAVLRGLTTKDQIVTEGAFAVKSAFLKGGMPKMEM
jgi:multidrug efflux pump subunit AcrA (membrane-fusion protein)